VSTPFVPREITERVVRKHRPEIEDDESETMAEQDRQEKHDLALQTDDDESATLADPHAKLPGYDPEPGPDIAIVEEPSHLGDTRKISAGAAVPGPALPFVPAPDSARAGSATLRASASSPPSSQRLPDSVAAPSSETPWSASPELDPSALPSSQLAELGVGAARVRASAGGRAKPSALPVVLLVVALVLGFAGTALLLHC